MRTFGHRIMLLEVKARGIGPKRAKDRKVGRLERKAMVQGNSHIVIKTTTFRSPLFDQ